jgi:hypothetical protein
VSRNAKVRRQLLRLDVRDDVDQAEMQFPDQDVPTHIPQIPEAFVANFSRLGTLGTVGTGGDAEKVEHVALQGRELRVKDFDEPAAAAKRVARGMGKQAGNLFVRRPPTRAVLGIKRQLREPLAVHAAADIALDQAGHAQGQTVEEEERLHAGLVLEQHGRDLVERS